MGDAYFSIIVWTHDTDMEYFKNLLESIDDQEYRNFELYIMDESGSDIERTIAEFFPDIVDKAHYRHLKKKTGGAYAYNMGAHFAEGDHLLFVGQHDRINTKALLELNNYISELEAEQDAIIYTDHDEIVGLDRMKPHFKSDFNKELFLHTDYIGGFICLSTECYKNLGNFNEKSKHSYIYEYILRCNSKRLFIGHIPMLLYHKRQEKVPFTKEERKAAAFVQKEFMAIAKSYLELEGVKANFIADPGFIKWNIEYDGSDFRRFGGDYMFLKDENVRLLTRKNVQYLYGFLKQPDVAVVGVRFLERGLTLNNVGYIYDEEGIIYPAFHGQKAYKDSYEGLSRIPRDVAMVDAGCCLIDAKIYRQLRGFDPRLSDREAMLDFCIRARAKGYRTIVVPKCLAKYKVKNNASSEDAHGFLMEKHGPLIKRGDGLYNKNLSIGVQNYLLPGMEEE